MLNSEQRRQLYAVLITIDASFVGTLLDVRSTVCGIINEQVLFMNIYLDYLTNIIN